MLNFCSIVAAILKMATGRNFSISGINVQLCSHLGQRAGPPDTILEEDHPMTILSKFGSN
jgi:hypothetical protein